MEKYEQPRILIEIFTKENVVFTSINWGGNNGEEEEEDFSNLTQEELEDEKENFNNRYKYFNPSWGIAYMDKCICGRTDSMERDGDVYIS